MIDKLREDKIPEGPIYGRLKAGETVKLDDGREICGQDYVGAPQKGRIVTILGDTRQTPAILIWLKMRMSWFMNVLLVAETQGLPAITIIRLAFKRQTLL